MSDINEPTMPAIPEAAVEAAAIALWNREGGGPDPVPGYIRHDAYATLAAALPHLSRPVAPAQAPGELVELVKRLRWRASMGGDYGQHERKLDTDAADAIAALTAADARVVELEREAAQWQAAAGQSLVRAEALEDRLETVERQRDEAREDLHFWEDRENKALLRAEAAEATVARLTKALEKISASASTEAPGTDEYEAMSNWDGVFHEGISVGLYRSATVARAALSTEQPKESPHA